MGFFYYQKEDILILSILKNELNEVEFFTGFHRFSISASLKSHKKIEIMHQSFVSPDSLGAGDSGDIAGPKCRILPLMSPGSAVDVPGF